MTFAIYPEEQIGKFLVFDVIKRDEHSAEQSITEYPVERGSNISDHARRKNNRFRFDGLVTRTPLEKRGSHGFVGFLDIPVTKYVEPFSLTPGGLFTAATDAIVSLFRDPAPDPLFAANVLQFLPFDPILDMFAELDLLIDTAAICTVTSFSKSYRGMLLKSYTAPTERTGAVVFSCEFQQVRIVSSSNVAAPLPKEPRGAPTAKAGAAGAGAPFENASFIEMVTKLTKDQSALARALGFPAFLVL